MISAITRGFAMIDVLRQPLAVVCHDAGSANLILAWLRTLKSEIGQVRAVMQGPAAVLWQDMFPGRAAYPDLQEALCGAQMVLTGTGWASALEHRARRLALMRNLPSVAMLDHWVNYGERFIRDGEKILPDEFWVTDDYAYEIACTAFPNKPVIRMHNFYLDAQLASIHPLPPGVPPEMLYVLEPARNVWGGESPGEFQALDYFVSRLPSLNLPSGTPIRVRPHPSDPPGKYSLWLRAHRRLGVVLDRSPNMAAALTRAQWVAGCETYALVVALAAGRTVYCSLPPWAPACRLPHHGLIHLKSME